MGSHPTLLAAGSNAKGQLGIGTYDDAHTFTPCRFVEHGQNQLPDLAFTVAQVACGANHTVLLLEHSDGSTTLWGTGDGRRGQLGPEYYREEPDSAPWTIFRKLVLPLHASREHTYKHIAAAWETTYVALSRPESSDVLVSMGSNDFGALGVGEGTNGDGSTGSARVVDFDHVFPDDAQVRTICIRSLHAGPRHVVAQLVIACFDGSATHSRTVLVGWGASRHGQLGQNGGTRFVARPTLLPIDIHEDPMVSCGVGNQHTVVLHASGRISTLGSNKQGQIPSLGSQRRICGLGCTWNGTYMQTIDGDRHVLLSTGSNAQGQLGRDEGSTSADDVAINLSGDRAICSFVCGSEHVLIAMSGPSREGNSVLGWGWNEHGNMGLGSLGNITSPTQLWPRGDVEMCNTYPQRATGIWAGCATSWLLVE